MKIKLPILLSVTLAIHAYAGSATWNLNPATNDWNTATNWTPNTVPNGPTDIATFALSNTTSVSSSDDISLGGLIFSDEAPAYTITIAEINHRLALYGDGVRNDSGVEQTILVPSGVIFFENASAGEDITYIGQGGVFGGVFAFFDNTSAGSATIYAYNGVDQGGFHFYDNSTAADATIVAGPFTYNSFYGGNDGQPSASNATITVLGAAHLTIFSGTTIDDATFIVEPATSAGVIGGTVEILGDDLTGGTFIANGAAVSGGLGGSGGTILVDSPGTAGTGTYTINGATKADGDSGEMIVEGVSAGAAFVTLNGGTNGGPGGKLTLREGASGGTARVAVYGNGFLNLNLAVGTTIGSIEGDGLVKLGRNSLTIGSNNLSTTFGGTIQDHGSITKVGSGILTLTGVSTYEGGTTITSGILLVSNVSGSGTGTGAVSVNAGTFGGSGIIAGAVTVGTNTGVQAFLAPSKGVQKPATLTIQSALTLNDDSTYIYKLNTKRSVSDEVIANGVVIDSGAKFSLRPSGNNALTTGQVFTVISNTSASPIAGTFHNLRNGQIISVNGSNLQASYTGGDGNDLTLTVVP
jgi:autotransporter-associated beta strand protein